jgi:SAM-dependent methyltransferase
MSWILPVSVAMLAALFHAVPAGSESPGPSGPPSVSPLQTLPPLKVPPPLGSPPVVGVQEPGEPEQGQAGKDVIWLPTPESVVERMLAMAQVGPRDVLYDLGSGDGRMVIAAAKRGAQAVGVEFNPELIAFSERRARAGGVAGRARFLQGDIFETDFLEATVVTLYLLPTLNRRLRPTLLAMRPGTRVVSHAYGMDDWSPDEISRTEGRTAYLWIVPAAVEGSWRVELQGRPPFYMTLARRYQQVEGTIGLGVVEAGLREPFLRGDSIRFGFVDQAGVGYELAGTVSGDRMSGAYQATDGKGGWTAERR